MTPKEFINTSFEEWWKREQGDRMLKSKYLAKKAWRSAFKSGAILQTKITDKITEKYKTFLDTI